MEERRSQRRLLGPVVLVEEPTEAPQESHSPRRRRGRAAASTSSLSAASASSSFFLAPPSPTSRSFASLSPKASLKAHAGLLKPPSFHRVPSRTRSVRLLIPQKPTHREEHLAASTGHTRWLQLCLQKSDTPTQADINGFSALHISALNGRLDCIKMLIEKYKVDVNLSSTSGWRPVHLVMSKESEGRALECLQYLIKKGADVNVQNNHGVTPLHKAASEGRLDCIKMLVEAGADVHTKDFTGQEPLDLCKMWGHRACAKYLASAMWKRDKKDYAYEVLRLKQLKEVFEVRERQYMKKQQMELDLANRVAYEEWLERKGVSPPSDRILGFLKKRGPSANIRSKSFIVLFRDRLGRPELHLSDWGKVSLLPELPFEVLQKNLRPKAQISRLEGPQDFKPKHIFDVTSRRPPSPEHLWTDQMELSLRETLDPAYTEVLKAHLATYTDPRVVFPQLESDYTSSRESSTQSQANSDPPHVARPC